MPCWPNPFGFAAASKVGPADFGPECLDFGPNGPGAGPDDVGPELVGPELVGPAGLANGDFGLAGTTFGPGAPVGRHDFQRSMLSCVGL